MPNPIDSPQEAFKATIADLVPPRRSEGSTIAGCHEFTPPLDHAKSENALIFSEIDRMLATAAAMAQYFERPSVCDAIALALRINRMEYEGRREVVRKI